MGSSATLYPATTQPPSTWITCFLSDPEVPPILQEAGHKGKPEAAELSGQYDA